MLGKPERGIQRTAAPRANVASQGTPDFPAPDKRHVPLVPVIHSADAAPGSRSRVEKNPRPPG
eukprot:8082613-Alexandrium_andersonii.AAC.1